MACGCGCSYDKVGSRPLQTEGKLQRWRGLFSEPQSPRSTPELFSENKLTLKVPGNLSDWNLRATRSPGFKGGHSTNTVVKARAGEPALPGRLLAPHSQPRGPLGAC